MHPPGDYTFNDNEKEKGAVRGRKITTPTQTTKKRTSSRTPSSRSSSSTSSSSSSSSSSPASSIANGVLSINAFATTLVAFASGSNAPGDVGSKGNFSASAVAAGGANVVVEDPDDRELVVVAAPAVKRDVDSAADDGGVLDLRLDLD